jgi:hypothetical protein
MFAPKIAKPHMKAPIESNSRLARPDSKLAPHRRQSGDQDESRALSLESATVRRDYDFSEVNLHSTSQDAVRPTTIPFKAVIRASRQNTVGRNKAVRDAPAEQTSAQPEPQRASSGLEPPSPEAETSSPVERDNNTLYIAQMGGPTGTKETTQTADAVSATFAYSGAPTRGGVTLGAGDFGLTKGHVNPFSNVVITAGAGKFTVTADLKQTVNWDTRATTGPDGQVNIMSETDAALTSANYAQAAADLTPNMTDLKGRPPRTKFWSKDLTEKHETFHADERVDFVKTAAPTAQTWLATQNAAKKEDVPALLDTAWNDKIFKPWDKFTDPPGVEERAYTDGAPSYKARADAIKAKGDKGVAGGYPAPP